MLPPGMESLVISGSITPNRLREELQNGNLLKFHVYIFLLQKTPTFK